MMPTVLAHDQSGIADAIDRALETAQTIIFPTDTVYGIGGNPWDERTLDRVRTLKERPADQPFTLHLASVKAIQRFVRVDDRQRAIVERLLPGPYTLLLPASDEAPPSAVLGSTIGIRVPDHPLFMTTLAMLDRPLFGTSVNLRGEPPLRDIIEIIDRFSSIDLIVTGPVGLGPSAILDLTADPACAVRGDVTDEVRRLLAAVSSERKSGKD